MPGGKKRKVVLADKKKERVGRSEAAVEVFKGEDGVRRFGSAEFQVGDGEAREVLDGEPAHAEAVVRGCGGVERTVDRGGGRDKIEAVEVQVLEGVHGGDEVSEVDGVERSAENADTLGRHGESMGLTGSKFKVLPVRKAKEITTTGIRR